MIPPMTERHICQNKLKKKILGAAERFEIYGRRYLEVKVGVLSSGYLVLVDVGVARLHGCRAVEWRVQTSGYLPIFTVVKDFIQRDSCNSANTRRSAHTYIY